MPPAAAAFSGRIHATAPIALAPLPPPPAGSVRGWFVATPALAGRSFPLATSGSHGVGDTLSLQIGADGTARLGYDSWGRPMLRSPEWPLAPNEQHTIEFQLPVVTPGDAEPEVLVRLNGREVWRQRAPFYPADAKKFFPGRNPIGASTAEDSFERAQFERGELVFRAPKK